MIPSGDAIVVDDCDIIPKVKVWDPYGFYWFRRVGFNRCITDEDR